MTETQSGQGATPERLLKSKIETIETSRAGEFVQVNVWPDVVAYMIDTGMLTQGEGYGWTDYQRLKHGMAGAGSGGEGFKQQELLIFQKLIGHAHLRVLHELTDYPVPGKGQQEERIVWMLRQCMPRIKQALSASSKAAQQAARQIEILILAQKPKI